MAGFQCPYCSQVMSLTNDTIVNRRCSFESLSGVRNGYCDDSCIDNDFVRCPNCGNYTIRITGIGAKVKTIFTYVLPKSQAKQLHFSLHTEIELEKSCDFCYYYSRFLAKKERRKQ